LEDSLGTGMLKFREFLIFWREYENDKQRLFA
jgi:hypothetical protein